jgi:predicted CopG family antitoxin
VFGVARKTIMVSEEVYEILASHKKPGESFNEVIKRVLSDRKKSIMDYWGAWEGTDEEFERIFREIDEMWREASNRIDERTRSVWTQTS